MLRFQITLAVILLVCCAALISCGRGQEMLEPVADDMMATDDMSTEMMDMMDTMMAEAEYKSWAHVTLPAPMMTVDEAAAAMNPGGTGAAHGQGPRTVYFNEPGAMANATGGPYPVGTMIVKEVMDATDTSLITGVVTMTKTDDPMYDAYNGWIYGTPEPLEMAQGCHDCHVKASKIIMEPTDSVFVSLPMDEMMDDMTDMTTDDMDKQMFEITLTNLTMGVHGMSGQTFSPAIFAAHPAGLKLAEVGQPASEALVAQAEGGKTDGLEALVEAAGAYYMIAMNEDGSRRYTMPGQSSMVTLMADKMMNSSLSVSSMLVSTNDAFIAAIDVPLFDADGMPVTTTINLMAYDAGSEDNTEKASDIPGPLGLDADADPAGSNARVPTEGGVIMAHPGIQGGGDVTEAFGWTEPIATLMITPVDASMGDDMDDMDDMGADMDNGGAQ
ncbi:hypothetical protein F4054_16965 [Candidatus Poribacteria bacterium]|nr:hypothetical protein [Candidatus Poribacteria bacterium]MYG05296.1 hypothetical protein [Candidatus Poribacteria bacterium]MYK23935.1 hypothetical protein [Candidatus Poribacteria bacterium]